MNRAERPYVMPPCLACGAKCNDARVFSGATGPFCSVACRDRNDDLKVWTRANDYAARVAEHRDSSGDMDFEESDVARAFVIGYAAGLEAGQTASGRRTVRR